MQSISRDLVYREPKRRSRARREARLPTLRRPLTFVDVAFPSLSYERSVERPPTAREHISLAICIQLPARMRAERHIKAMDTAADVYLIILVVALAVFAVSGAAWLHLR